MTAYETLTPVSDSTNHNNLELGNVGINDLLSRKDMENFSSVKMACGFGNAEEHLPEFGFEEEGDQAELTAEEDQTTDSPLDTNEPGTTDNPRGSLTEEPSGEGEVMTDANEDGEVNRCPF